MRMWMTDPKIMCNQHLLGEHVELHMFMGCIKKKIKLDGYVEHNCLEFLELNNRHNELVNEMLNRAMNHKSELSKLTKEDIENYNHEIVLSEVNKEQSLINLTARCKNCRERQETKTCQKK